MPRTALQHFRQDIARARAILRHADPLPKGPPAEEMLRSDLLRSAWMFGVGAVDAYFSDAYADILAATALTKLRQPTVVLPDALLDIKVPIRAVLESYDVRDWRWRMAARTLVDSTNFLSLSTIQKAFNPFLRKDQRFFGSLWEKWVQHPDSTIRLLGMRADDYRSLDAAGKSTAKRAISSQFEDRFREIFQRRHDCIHNCDRPRLKPQPLSRAGTVERVLQDAEFLVGRSDEHLAVEFREFLLECNATAAVIAQVGY